MVEIDRFMHYTVYGFQQPPERVPGQLSPYRDWPPARCSGFNSRGRWEFFSFPLRLASYPLGTGGSFVGGKAAGAWGWPLTF